MDESVCEVIGGFKILRFLIDSTVFVFTHCEEADKKNADIIADVFLKKA